MRGCAAQPFPWRYASTGHTAVQGDMPRLTTRGVFARVMCPIAAMCAILHCWAYVHTYVSSCDRARDSAPGLCTRLCVSLRPCTQFCARRMYAFMRPLAAMCTILRRAYVRVYASSCDRARDSAPGVCTRLCVLLRPCARFCAGRMYTLMRPLATERAILRRAYVRAYACALPHCRSLANTLSLIHISEPTRPY